jgi:hypothetical protein
MQALDSFISPIPGFEGDIPIPTITVSARPPSSESASNPTTEANAGGSKTRVGKRKAPVILTPSKKARKTTGKSNNGIKINEPTPKDSTPLTPPSSGQKKILTRRSNMYAHL